MRGRGVFIWVTKRDFVEVRLCFPVGQTPLSLTCPVISQVWNFVCGCFVVTSSSLTNKVVVVFLFVLFLLLNPGRVSLMV